MDYETRLTILRRVRVLRFLSFASPNFVCNDDSFILTLFTSSSLLSLSYHYAYHHHYSSLRINYSHLSYQLFCLIFLNINRHIIPNPPFHLFTCHPLVFLPLLSRAAHRPVCGIVTRIRILKSPWFETMWPVLNLLILAGLSYFDICRFSLLLFPVTPNPDLYILKSKFDSSRKSGFSHVLR